MTVFQVVFLTILSGVILSELWGLWKGAGNWRVSLVRLVIWTAAAVAIAKPGLTQIVAHAAGIDRGADLVSYLFALSFLATSFYYYSRYVRLQRQVTEIVRHLAILEANRRG